ncbi:GNAT family N-acetyltransferase [Clostridium tagluense]|uniref:GNAT family N-acetyltransferase n=1 Tax=Clostridium TaxID=1485 RepID=UPI0013E8FF44|nr:MULTISPECIES: GNAT family N-acetyltransferase [Clostridium]MBU3130267.1 GNAT family N-acetyltransferase [Clostridium tagluense]MBW9158216.1 GNAT family N-acetyltransferase [Clostridium tagluense]MBZ9623371.1 GNAT family N-acetyltransferase [Clostridium sp. FP2]MBZ9634760.1 GNAT family N-acetyltransferase [Clostridium sp. FP1]MCB2298534.1 GNAT family N-acetyltransferase [Clostridium tagluense]
MEKMSFEVRKAFTSDIEEIRILAGESFKMYTANASITELIAPLNETYEEVKKAIETTEVFVALYNEEVIGSVRIEIKPDGTAYLSRFGVSASHQNNGIGKILMNAIDNSMKELGITSLYLHTASRMFSLIRFYYGRGFYIESTTNDRGYIRALLCKEYITEKNEDLLDNDYENRSVV